MFLCGHLALLGAYALLVVPLGDSPALAGAVLALHGGFYAATDGVLAAATADTVPAAVRGSGLAVVQTGQAVARFVCSIAFGAAWTAWGDRTALGTAAVGLCVSTVAGALLLRPTRIAGPTPTDAPTPTVGAGDTTTAAAPDSPPENTP